MTLEETLDQSLHKSYDAHKGVLDQTWVIRTDDDAAWASRKAQEAQGNLERIQAWAKRERERIDEIVERESAPYLFTLESMTTHLHLWLQQLISEGRKRKSVDLPGGRFSLRTVPSAAKVDDQTQFLAWAKANAPQLVRTKEAVDLTELRRLTAIEGNQVILTDTGEVVPHVIVDPSRESALFQVGSEQ